MTITPLQLKQGLKPEENLDYPLIQKIDVLLYENYNNTTPVELKIRVLPFYTTCSIFNALKMEYEKVGWVVQLDCLENKSESISLNWLIFRERLSGEELERHETTRLRSKKEFKVFKNSLK